MKQLAEDLGGKLEVEGQIFHAFPQPADLFSLASYRC
jgi:hypothetical protein